MKNYQFTERYMLPSNNMLYVLDSLSKYCIMAPEIWANIGPGNGMLPDGKNPLREPILTYD